MGQWLKCEVCKENLLTNQGIPLNEIKMLYRNAGISIWYGLPSIKKNPIPETSRISIQLLL